MRVCWDAEVGVRAPCGALSSQNSLFLPISRMIVRPSDAAGGRRGLRAGFALDRELQLEGVLQLDRRGADEAGVAVGRAEVRHVERAFRAAAGERLRREDGVVADDLRAGADAF